MVHAQDMTDFVNCNLIEAHRDCARGLGAAGTAVLAKGRRILPVPNEEPNRVAVGALWHGISQGTGVLRLATENQDVAGCGLRRGRVGSVHLDSVRKANPVIPLPSSAGQGKSEFVRVDTVLLEHVLVDVNLNVAAGEVELAVPDVGVGVGGEEDARHEQHPDQCDQRWTAGGMAGRQLMWIKICFGDHGNLCVGNTPHLDNLSLSLRVRNVCPARTC